MRIGLMLIAAIVAVLSFGQGLLPRRSLGGRLTRSSPVAQNDEIRFLEQNPTGTNAFNRTYPAQREFEKDFVLERFLGFEFGVKAEGEKTRTLAKPFRMFEKVSLGSSAKGRLYKVSMEQKTKDLSQTSISNEVVMLIAMLEKQYQIGFKVKGWGHKYWSTYGMSAEFKNEKARIAIEGTHQPDSGDGDLKIEVENIEVRRADWKRQEDERLATVAKRQKDVSLSATEGEELLAAAKPNVRTGEVAAVEVSPLSRRFRRNDPDADLLEPLLTMREAADLAKLGSPKGYYQLAILISRNRSWTDKTFDANKNIEFCLLKACESGYVNARFLKALLSDLRLGDAHRYSFGSGSPSEFISKYTGFSLSSWSYTGSLTNEADVAVVRQEYLKLKSEGFKPAEVAIANLEARVASAKDAVVKSAAKAAAHDEMADLVRSVITLPKDEPKVTPTERLRDSAKRAGRVYLQTNAEDTKDIGWDVKDEKPLTIELQDAMEGDIRELRFAADGRLIYVSPVLNNDR